MLRVSGTESFCTAIHVAFDRGPIVGERRYGSTPRAGSHENVLKALRHQQNRNQRSSPIAIKLNPILMPWYASSLRTTPLTAGQIVPRVGNIRHKEIVISFPRYQGTTSSARRRNRHAVETEPSPHLPRRPPETIHQAAGVTIPRSVSHSGPLPSSKPVRPPPARGRERRRRGIGVSNEGSRSPLRKATSSP